MNRTSAGISLVEFTISLTVLGAILMLTAPLLFRIAHDQRASQYTNELVSALVYARAQAVTMGQPVTVCASRDGQQCTDTPWTQGYIVFLDNDSPGIVDGADRVLKYARANYPKLAITLRDAQYVRFSRVGTLVATGRGDALAPTELVRWLDKLSPIASARADDLSPEDAALTTRPTTDGTRRGVFIVCYRDIGRTVLLSNQGRITTAVASCTGRS